MTQELDKALSRAKIGLMSHGSVFLITIAFNLRYEWCEDIPTADVDGITIRINPDFFSSLNEEERIFLLAHESWHVAFDHIQRRGNLIPDLWNRAGDYVINILLQDAQFSMPKNKQGKNIGLVDPKYRGWSTEKVYNDLENDPQKQSMPDGMSGDIVEPTKEQMEEIAVSVKNILVKATAQSKMAGEQPGSIPGEIIRDIEEMLNPVLPWQTLLDNFMTERTKDDYSWQRPNKRFMPDFHLPTQYSEALAHITIAIDTSGSVTPQMMTEILSEIVHIKEAFKPKKLTILDCDSHIHNTYEVEEYDNIMDLKFSGGGGTSFEPVINWCKKRETKALLYFTDLYASMIKTDPGFPLIWLCYSSHSPAPIGETIYYEEKHRQ